MLFSQTAFLHGLLAQLSIAAWTTNQCLHAFCVWLRKKYRLLFLSKHEILHETAYYCNMFSTVKFALAVPLLFLFSFSVVDTVVPKCLLLHVHVHVAVHTCSNMKTNKIALWTFLLGASRVESTTVSSGYTPIYPYTRARLVISHAFVHYPPTYPPTYPRGSVRACVCVCVCVPLPLPAAYITKRSAHTDQYVNGLQRKHYKQRLIGSEVIIEY